jgi:hypothetical protein
MEQQNNESDVLVIPSIARLVMPEFQKDRGMMSVIHADIIRSRQWIRDAFLKEGNIINKHDGSRKVTSIRVVDGSVATVNSGEFSVLLALGVNISTEKETPLKAEYHHVCAPNSESFGMLASPVMAAAEALSLAPMANEGYTLYDGSLQGLNMNLGNLFRTQSDSGYLSEVTEYTDKLESLFSDVVDPRRDLDPDLYVGRTVYSSIFNKARKDLFAISKRNTSTYTFHRIEKFDGARDALGSTWFSYPKSDRLILNQVLEAGEYIGPVPFHKVESKSGHTSLMGLSDVAKQGDRQCNEKEYVDFCSNLYFLFFKPAPHSPAMRIEIVADRDDLEKKVHDILSILVDQCSNPGLVEPYGLWLADKIAKQIQAFKQIYGTANAIDYPELFRPNRTEDISK